MSIAVNRTNGEMPEAAAFKEFNDAFGAFGGLNGTLSEADTQAYTDFAMRISYPPNPIRHLDIQLRVANFAAKNYF